MVKERRSSNKKALASAGQYLMVEAAGDTPTAVPTLLLLQPLLEVGRLMPGQEA